MILRPMKAPSVSITDEQLKSLTYPVYGSPKLDGFRALTRNGKVLTSSLKELPNAYVQSILSDPLLDGLDGELIVGSPYSEHPEDNVFNRTSGPLRRSYGEPDFTFYVFDYTPASDLPYHKRLDFLSPRFHPHVVVISQCILSCPEAVLYYEAEMLEAGYEGIMLRSPSAPYKFGRCTAKEAYIFKRKPCEDVEAVIIGFEEQEENLNEKVTSELGVSKRSSHKENKRGKGTLGAFILKSKLWEEPFSCGTGQGLTPQLRQDIWNNREKYLGKIVTVKYQAYGSIDKPRQPIYKGFRDKWDMTEEP